MSGQRPKKRAIIIDDDPIFAANLSRLISELDYEVTVSTDPQKSFTFYLKDSDTVFLDVIMPDFSVFSILKKLALQSSRSRLILMSGSLERLDEAETLARQLNLNLMGVLDKPFRLEDVKHMLTMAQAKPISSIWY